MSGKVPQYSSVLSFPPFSLIRRTDLKNVTENLSKFRPVFYSGVSFSTNEVPGIKIPGTALSEFSSDLFLHSAAYLHIVPCFS